MKTCPSCRRAYEDESLVFCLDDGARLERKGVDANATLTLPTPGPTVASPRPTPPTGQSTITARPEPFSGMPPQVRTDHTRSESRRSVLPWVFAIVLVFGASGVLIAWLVTRGRSDEVAGKYPVPQPSPTAKADTSPSATPEIEESPRPNETPRATPDRSTKEYKPPKPTPVPTPARPKAMFAVMNNISFNGSRITYYPRPSFGQCQADCAGNQNCKGFTWIRPGAYNPGDSAMCYLMSAVTARIPHPCCISAVKN